MKKCFKTIISTFLSSVLFISVITVSATAEGNNIYSEAAENFTTETTEIKNVVEGFFIDYESNFDKNDVDNTLYEDYFIQNKTSDTEINIALIDAILYQRIANVRHHYSGEQVRELNKEISFDYSEIEILDNTATAEVCVSKTFNYSICPDVESATLDSYSIDLKKENGEWKIAVIDNFVPEDIKFSLESQGINIDNLASISNYKSSIVSAIQSYNTDISDSMENPIPISALRTVTSTYDADGAVSYANTYALSPNPNYFNIESLGGDCTNFASQVMHEGGGIPMHYGTHGYNTSWFYSSSSNRSTSWAGAQYLYDYMHSSYSKISYSTTNWSSISKGDLIQVGSTTNIGHSMIVTGIVYSSSGRSDLLVTYRSVTNYHRKNILLSSRGSETRQYIHINGGK